MRIENLKYEKGEASTEIIEVSPIIKSESTHSDNISILNSVSADYSKGEPFLSTKIMFILSGGSKREKDYFKPLKEDDLVRSIKIAFRSKEGQGLKPYELKSLAEEFIEKKQFVTEDNKSFRIEEEDIIYLLQDVDEFSDELKLYLTKNEQQAKYKWIISNPSFEIWLYYHYSDSTEPLSKGMKMTARDRSNWLKEQLNTIVVGGVKTTKALYTVESAIANSRKNYREENSFPNLYSTQMHIIGESILSIMETEFPDMKNRQAEKIAFYKNRLKRDDNQKYGKQ